MMDRAHSLQRIYNDNAARRDYLWGRLRVEGSADVRAALQENRVEDWPDDLRRAQEMLLLVSELIWQRTKLDALYQAIPVRDSNEETTAILRELAAILDRFERAAPQSDHPEVFAQVLVPRALLARARAVLAGKEDA